LVLVCLAGNISIEGDPWQILNRFLAAGLDQSRGRRTGRGSPSV